MTNHPQRSYFLLQGGPCRWGLAWNRTARPLPVSMKELTREQAVALYESTWWEDCPAHAIAEFQLYQDRLCCPFGVFQGSVEKALGRPVWTHEFANPEILRKELLGERRTPSFEEILDLIPAQKRIIVLNVS